MGSRLGWGVLLGLAAGVLLGGLDVVLSAQAVAEQLDTLEARQRFALQLLGLTALGGGLWGLVQALLNGALIRLAERLRPGDQPAARARQRRWLGGLWALLLSPLCAWVVVQMFSGPRAQRLPGRPALMAALGLLGLVAIAGKITILLGLRQRIRAQRSGAVRALLAGGLCAVGVAAMVVLGLIDRRVLPRLYPWFHLSLQALQLVSAYAALWGLCAAVPESGDAADPDRPGTRRTTLLLLLAAGLGLLGSSRLAERLVRAQLLRGLALEHTGTSATLVRGYLLLRRERPARTRPLPPSPDSLSAEPTGAPPPYSGPRLSGRDVFLITVDALRHDRVTPATMPFVAGLLPRSVVFERAYTQVPHTSFAVATLLTGKPVYALLTLGQDAASHETLPLILRRFRYKTAAFYPPSVFFVERERLKGLEESAYGFEYVKFEYLGAPRRTDQILRFLDDEQPARVFVWAHYLEPHEPYDVHPGGPGPEAGDRERYDGEVRAVDAEIRRLYDEVQRRRPGALFIIAADHGEEFGEHGGRYHGTSLYDEQARVPLLFFDAAARPLLRPQRLVRPVGLVDVAPTLLGLLDIEPPLRMRGRDLAPWLLVASAAPGGAPGPSGAASEPPLAPVFSEIGRRKMVALGDHKLVCDFAADACQLFDLLHDPAERRNLIDADPATASRLRAHLDRAIAEAQRYEAAAGSRSSAGSLGLREAVARARMGDRTALPRLREALTEPDLRWEQRAEAVALLGHLIGTAVAVTPGGPDPLRTATGPGTAADPMLGELGAPATLDRLRSLRTEALRRNDPVTAGWAAIALVRLGAPDPASKPELLSTVSTLITDESAPAPQRLAGALTLLPSPSCAPGTGALDCVALALKVLPAAMALDDPDEVRPLLLLLGRSRDPRALAALLPQLAVVRARPDVVTALGLLGSPEAIPELSRLLTEDPYVPVRAAAATALGRIGGPAARTELQRAQLHERESPVRTAIQNAQHPPTP